MSFLPIASTFQFTASPTIIFFYMQEGEEKGSSSLIIGRMGIFFVLNLYQRHLCLQWAPTIYLILCFCDAEINANKQTISFAGGGGGYFFFFKFYSTQLQPHFYSLWGDQGGSGKIFFFLFSLTHFVFI